MSARESKPGPLFHTRVWILHSITPAFWVNSEKYWTGGILSRTAPHLMTVEGCGLVMCDGCCLKSFLSLPSCDEVTLLLCAFLTGCWISCVGYMPMSHVREPSVRMYRETVIHSSSRGSSFICFHSSVQFICLIEHIYWAFTFTRNPSLVMSDNKVVHKVPIMCIFPP